MPPSVTQEVDSNDDDLEVDVQEAWHVYEQTKREMKNGRLVNWQDAIKSQKVNMPSLVMRCSVLTATSRICLCIALKVGPLVGGTFSTSRKMRLGVIKNGRRTSRSASKSGSSKGSKMRRSRR